jgi:hypothetical protein
LDEVRESIGETNIKIAEVSTQMAAHVESDTTCFERIDRQFDALHKKLEEVCLSKTDAKKEAGKSGAIWASIVSLLIAVISACAQVVGH